MTISNIAPTTELEALNQVLSSALQAPVASLSSTQPDVQTALSKLRIASSEVQSKSWVYNTMFGLELVPTGTMTVAAVARNIFTPPAKALNVVRSGRTGSKDIVLRQAVLYEPSAGVFPLIIADRENSRDWWDDSTLVVDAVFAFDFGSIPQVIRHYITVKAARQFAQVIHGDADRSGFLINDERMAWMACLRDQSPSHHGYVLTDAERAQTAAGRQLSSQFDHDAIWRAE